MDKSRRLLYNGPAYGRNGRGGSPAARADERRPPMKRTFTALLFVLAFIVIAAGVFLILTRFDEIYNFTGSPTPEVVSVTPTTYVAPVTTPFAVPSDTVT